MKRVITPAMQSQEVEVTNGTVTVSRGNINTGDIRVFTAEDLVKIKAASDGIESLPVQELTEHEVSVEDIPRDPTPEVYGGMLADDKVIYTKKNHTSSNWCPRYMGDTKFIAGRYRTGDFEHRSMKDLVRTMMRRGYEVFQFSDLAEALRWVLGEVEAPPTPFEEEEEVEA